MLWVSYALYRFEANVRSATVVGMVGAGGIGVILWENIRAFQFVPLAPVARTPSTGPGSMASTASANSLARTPVVLIHKARTPAKGPRPTATTNNMANTISLIERKASITRRSGWGIHREFGVSFNASGD